MPSTNRRTHSLTHYVCNVHVYFYRNGFCMQKYPNQPREIERESEEIWLKLKTFVRFEYIFDNTTHNTRTHYFNLLILYHSTAGSEQAAAQPTTYILSSHLSTGSFFGVVIEKHANISTRCYATSYIVNVRKFLRHNNNNTDTQTHTDISHMTINWTWLFVLALNQFTWNTEFWWNIVSNGGILSGLCYFRT